jgi:hypothetical protein
MADTRSVRQSVFRSQYAIQGTALELVAAPGTDATQIPADLGLPTDAAPAGVAGRILLLRFTSGANLDPVTAERVAIQGATVRWLAAADDLVAVAASDGDLSSADNAWFADLVSALQAHPEPIQRWLVVVTEAVLPDTTQIEIRQAAGDTDPGAPLDGFEPQLSSLTLIRDEAATTRIVADWLNAIDYVIVADNRPFISQRLRQRILFVAFENAFALADLDAERIRITGGNRIPSIQVRWVWPLAGITSVAAADTTLSAGEQARLSAFAATRTVSGDVDDWVAICTEGRGDFSTYTLTVVNDARFDPLLSSVPLRLKLDCLDGFDCKTASVNPQAPIKPLELDYMTRDFAGFRRLMADRLAQLGAAPADLPVAGLWSVLVEAIAYRADQLAQMQDAVATEAYLQTARLRSSVRRHARLLDYRMHEGVNSRAWVHVEAAAGVNRSDGISTGDVCVTRLANAPAVLPLSVLDTAFPEGTEFFHVLLPPRRLSAAHNGMSFYTWGETDLVLAEGATSCTLRDPGGQIELQSGDAVVLEAVASSATGLAVDADPALRHVVRLNADPVSGIDRLLGENYLEITWDARDALPFDLIAREDGRELALARANLTLVAHGIAREEEILVLPWGSRGRLIAKLSRRGLTWAAIPPEDDGDWSASGIVRQMPAEALPDITLEALDSGEIWFPRQDLLTSDRSVAEFCVEMETDGSSRIRFGDDVTGRSPAANTRFRARYRTGYGSQGNVGAQTIAHIVSDSLPSVDVVALRNPRAAEGGTEPETIAQARAAAPYAFRRQERAVTMEDWAEVSTREGDVQRAVARLRWTGSWHNVRVHVDPSNAVPVDEAFTDRSETRLEPYRLAGYGLEVVGPIYVPLDIALTVCVAPDVWPEAVRATLEAEFSTGHLPDGRRAFFHPDNFTFGDSVYLSQIVARAMDIHGVRWVDARRVNSNNRFRRWASTMPDQLDTGVLEMGDLEVPQCFSDPSTPDKGRVTFIVEGGT